MHARTDRPHVQQMASRERLGLYARSIQQGEKMDAIVELLKIVVGLAVIIGIIRYCMGGLPPRGKGRRRRVLSDLELRDDSHTRGARKRDSAPDRLNGK